MEIFLPGEETELDCTSRLYITDIDVYILYMYMYIYIVIYIDMYMYYMHVYVYVLGSSTARVNNI